MSQYGSSRYHPNASHYTPPPITVAQKIFNALHQHNPYEGFDPKGLEPTKSSQTRDAFLPVIDKLQPNLAVEVGAWKGATSIVLANAMRQAHPDSCLVCVDTWLGSIEHFTTPPSEEWDIRPTRINGYPHLYEYWMTTILNAGVKDIVVPLPNTSTTAAKWFAKVNISPKFIFLDAGHDEDDVAADLSAWWPTLQPDGILAGDDWSSMWPGVERAVTAFCQANNLSPQIIGPNWLIQKNAAPNP